MDWSGLPSRFRRTTNIMRNCSRRCARASQPIRLSSSAIVRKNETVMISFVKAHACGNDFLILEEEVARRQHAALARKLCSRNTSIGADGIEFLERKANGELFLRLFNADGSEAELSGNGTRCVAAWLASSEGMDDVVLGTHGGPRRCHVVEDADPVYLIESEMGVPRVIERTIVVDGVGEVPGAMVNVGNPHFVLFVESDDFSAHGLRWQELGARISTSPLFPHGTNVEFVRVQSKSEIAFRIFEGGDSAARSGSRTDSCGRGRGTARGVDFERRGDAADWAGGDYLPG